LNQLTAVVSASVFPLESGSRPFRWTRATGLDLSKSNIPRFTPLRTNSTIGFEFSTPRRHHSRCARTNYWVRCEKTAGTRKSPIGFVFSTRANTTGVARSNEPLGSFLQTAPDGFVAQKRESTQIWVRKKRLFFAFCANLALLLIPQAVSLGVHWLVFAHPWFH
jgi:hypothetical protein